MTVRKPVVLITGANGEMAMRWLPICRAHQAVVSLDVNVRSIRNSAMVNREFTDRL
jgi:hypothetical protein